MKDKVSPKVVATVQFPMTLIESLLMGGTIVYFAPIWGIGCAIASVRIASNSAMGRNGERHCCMPLRHCHDLELAPCMAYAYFRTHPARRWRSTSVQRCASTDK